jgi:hypothetical protein
MTVARAPARQSMQAVRQAMGVDESGENGLGVDAPGVRPRLEDGRGDDGPDRANLEQFGGLVGGGCGDATVQRSR